MFSFIFQIKYALRIQYLMRNVYGYFTNWTLKAHHSYLSNFKYFFNQRQSQHKIKMLRT